MLKTMQQTLIITAALVACGDDKQTDEVVYAAEPNLVVMLTPDEYNNTIRELLGMPETGASWPEAPPISERLNASQGEQAGLFGTAGTEPPPWPWAFPAEAGVEGFDGMVDGQTPSTYRTEEFQKAAVHFASYALVSTEFFVCDEWDDLPVKDQASCAEESIVRFAQRAWRRGLTAQEQARVEAALQTSWAAGEPDEAVVLTAAGILQSPQFLFKVEVGSGPADSSGNVQLTGWEVASRLSYLLWDSMPDSELFRAAASGELLTTEGVRTQTRRMLEDRRAGSAMVRFHQQWLDIDGLLSIAPAQRAYGPLYGLDPSPELDTTGDGEWPMVMGPLRHSMSAEFSLFVREHLLEGDGRLSTLLSSNEGWMSDESASLYGDAVEDRPGTSRSWSYSYIANSLPYSGTLTLDPVTWPEDQRAGLLTMPAVLAVGAYPVHPAPILRGKRLLERLTCFEFGAPPPGAEGAAPPDTETAEGTNRTRTEQATSPDTCAGCHSMLNPPGFAYEHYDAMGRYRTEDGGEAVDATGEFGILGGESFSFSDGVQLAKQLAESPRVRSCYALRWARLATGQHLEEDDERIAALTQRFVSNDDVQQLLEDITTSDWFSQRTPGGEQ